MNEAQSAVLGNQDLLRLIEKYIIPTQLLPFILSFKAVRDALQPRNNISGQKWIISDKRAFVTSVTMVKWAQSLDCEFSLDQENKNLFTYASTHGSVEVLTWLHKKYPPSQYSAGVNMFVCAAAAENGHLAVLEYLRSLGSIVEWNLQVCCNAAREGHLHILQWLREILDPPCPWGEDACMYAAYKGHLYILKWLRAQDPPCPWDEWTCYWAAAEGRFDVLKWLRSQDPPCPWDKEQCIRLARIDSNHHETVEWILTQPE